MELKTTPFTETHIALGAKMAEFAGFNMPINYANGINHEHMTVVNGVGVFDVSHMGEFMVTGPRAKEFLGRVCSNNLKLIEGQAQYNCFPNGKGGIVDDLIVYHYNDEKYLLVVNAANIDKDWAWVNKNNAEGVCLENISDHVAQLAVQGPKAILALQKLTDVKLDEIKYYHFAVGTFAGCEDVIISATGYTGAGGFELYFNPAFGDKIWKAVFEAGAEFGIEPIGLGARDTLRLEMGFCLYGHEIDDETSPIEAGLGWITKPAEGKNLIDGELYVQQRAEGTKKKLVGFEMQQDRAIPRKDYEVTDGQGNVIGVVTSGCMSPCRGIGVGMAHVKPEFSKIDSTIYIKIRNKEIPAMVVKMPFRH